MYQYLWTLSPSTLVHLSHLGKSLQIPLPYKWRLAFAAISTSWLLWNWYTLTYYLGGPNGFLHFCCVHIRLDALGQPVRSSSWMSVSPFSWSLRRFLTCSALVTLLSYTCIIFWWSVVHTFKTNHNTNVFMGQNFVCFGHCVSAYVMSTVSRTDLLATPVACYTYCKFYLLRKPGCW